MAANLDLIRNWAERTPTKLAVISEQQGTRTYAELVRGIDECAAFLTRDLGLRAGAKVGLWGWNSPEWIEVFFACQAAGLIACPINPEWTTEEASRVVSVARMSVLFHDSELTKNSRQLAQDFDHLRATVLFGSAIADRRSGGDPPEAPAASAPAQPFFFTSGTTGGKPKAVVRSIPSKGAGQLASLFKLTDRDRYLVVTPFSHANASSAVIVALTSGASVVFARKFSAGGFWSLVDRFHPTIFYTLMPILSILASRPPNPLEGASSLRYVFALGVAPYAEQIEARFCVKALDWYGSTETGGLVYTPVDEPRPRGATGKAIPGIPLEIVRENMTPCAPGEIGQVVVAAREVGFVQYADDPEATAAAMHGHRFLTGDMGYLDAQGWFYFVDRLKDIVRRGGQNISSLEVEAVLTPHPAIREIAIVPRPDPILGERVTAFLVPRNRNQAPSPDQLAAFAADRLARHKLPDLVIELAELPRTETGKVKKAALKERLREGAFAS